MKEKKFKYPKVYLYATYAGLAAILGLVSYYLFASVSTKDEAQYVYIDDDDNIDSVFAKMEPFASQCGGTAFRNVKNIKYVPKRNLIKVNETLTKNRVYVPDVDYHDVYQFICAHCPQAKKS